MIKKQTEKEKRDDIVALVDRSAFVEAGAGAGKTTLIVERITNQIRRGTIKPEELVVITFTNKAAGELYERIQAKFEREEKNASNTDEERARFTYAIEHLEQMHISTIHSFCFTLLKERCFDAKLPLGVTLLENADTVLRQQRFFKRWFAQLGKADVEKIKKANMYLKGNAYYYGEKVEEIFRKSCEKPQDINFVMHTEEDLEKVEGEIVAKKTEAESLLQQLNQELNQIANTGVAIYETKSGLVFYPDMEGVSPKGKSFYKYYAEGYPNKGKNKTTYNNLVVELYTGELFDLCKKGAKKNEKELYADINEDFHAWVERNIRPNQTFQRYKAADERRKELAMSYAYETFLHYAVKAREHYLLELTGKELSNDQLIQKARDLVCNSPEACAYFGEKYKCIYVDEFQDTDHIQAELVWKLATDETGTLKQGALFIVGDPKQAIYRFRGGEPAVYNEIKQRMSKATSEACVYELDNNYRSNKEVIAWVNDQFAPVITGSGIFYRDMVCASKDYPEEHPKAESDVILKGVYGFDALASREIGIGKPEHEAAVLAETIQKLVSDDFYIYETRKENDTYVRNLRRVGYGDFLILCWDTTQMDYYTEAMKQQGIPLELAGKEDVSDSRVLNSFLALYRFLLEPYDGKSKQGARHIVCHGMVASEKAIADTRLEKLQKKTENLNAYGKAQFLLTNLEYLIPWDEDISKEDLYALQARMHQMVEMVFSIVKDKPEQILQEFEKFISNKLERELALTKDKKAVRFMNLHKAKGLEGAITILTNRKARTREKVPEYTSSEKNAEGNYDYYGVFSDAYTKLHGYGYDDASKKVLEKAKQETEAEEVRLDYVAATRAKEVLIVMKEHGEGAAFHKYTIPEENDLGVYLSEEEADEYDDIYGYDDYKNEEDVDVLDASEGEDGIYNLEDWENDDVQEKEELKVATYVPLSPSDLEEKQKSEKHELTERRPKGNIFGTTMHRSFELYVLQRIEGESPDVDVCIGQAIIENVDELFFEGQKRYLKKSEPDELYLQAVRDFLKIALEKFAEDKAIQELFANASEVYTELPFSYFTSREENPKLFAAIDKHLEAQEIAIKENQPVYVNGSADLVIVGRDGQIHIIDFKSDTKYEADMDAFEQRLNKKYEGQLLLYKYSLSHIFKTNVDAVSTRLYHLY